VLLSVRVVVKKSSSVLKLNLKLLGTSQDMEIVDDRAPAQIEEILAQSPIACAPSLPVTEVSQGMLHRDPFAQFGASLRRLLVLAQFYEQGFIGMDADTPVPKALENLDVIALHALQISLWLCNNPT
jgi:hypothetical protein